MKRTKSAFLYERARSLIPHGVNSPVRAFLSVKETPLYVKKAEGPYIIDVDGNIYIDYISSWGSIILGHGERGLIEEIKMALEEGTSFGLCHPYEVEFAALIKEVFSSIELFRCTNSGTEAVMSAIRLARGYTGKKAIIKFQGCYHGHVDSLLVKAGSGLATYGIPESKGIVEELAKYTFVADFNDLASVQRIIETQKEEIACIIIEPIMGNIGVVLPEPSFIKGLESLCRENGILLIFDEVITGFRVTYGGAQHLFDVKPDLTCLGKIIGGGFPIGGFGGKKEIMERLAPLGDVYQAGTLSGNPIALRAGLYVLQYLKANKEIYDKMGNYVKILKEHIERISKKYNVPYRVNGITGMFSGFFSTSEIKGYKDATFARKDLFENFFRLMLEEGILFAPSPFEASFITASHGEKELERTIEAYERVFRKLEV